MAVGLAGGGADAAKKKYPCPRFETAPVAEWRDDGISLRFRAGLDRRLKRTETVTLCPRYVAGTDTVSFPMLSFVTGSEEKYLRRRESKSEHAVDRMTMVQTRDGFPPFDYSRSVPSPKRRGGHLEIDAYYSSCCDSAQLGSEPVSIDMVMTAEASATGALAQAAYASPCPQEPCSDLPEPVLRVPLELSEANVSLLRPEAEEVKTRDVSVTLHLQYPSGRHDIDPRFNGNAGELEALDEVLGKITKNPDDYTVNSISITGYASPEGTSESNLALSARRAGGLKRYISDRYGLSPALIRIEGKGEDWEGLVRLVEESPFPGSGEALGVIRRYPVFGGREKRLMDLRGGEPYRHMLSRMFPRLRRLEATVDYEVRAFDGPEAAARLATAPDDLSLREMWDAMRASMPDSLAGPDRKDYGAEYYVMARYFPDSDIANVNAASAALVRGDLAAARRFLAAVATSPLGANDTGLYYWMCGMPAEARAYFRIAALTEPDRAAHNLRELGKWENQ